MFRKNAGKKKDDSVDENDEVKKELIRSEQEIIDTIIEEDSQRKKIRDNTNVILKDIEVQREKVNNSIDLKFEDKKKEIEDTKVLLAKAMENGNRDEIEKLIKGLL